MQKLDLSVALIRRNDVDGTRWLARSIPNRSILTFVISDRLEQESFRESAIREVAWELNLDRLRDYLVSNMAQMNMEFVDVLPGQPEKTHVVVSFYNVEIYRKKVMHQLNEDPCNVWLSSSEICEGMSTDQQMIDPIVPFLINRSNVIQHWESYQR